VRGNPRRSSHAGKSQSIDRTLLVNNVAALAKAAKDLGVPTVLTTVGASGGPLNDPLFGQIGEVVPDEVPIDRVTTNAWEPSASLGARAARGADALVLLLRSASARYVRTGGYQATSSPPVRRLRATTGCVHFQAGGSSLSR
jgi:hypothetical protein